MNRGEVVAAVVAEGDGRNDGTRRAANAVGHHSRIIVEVVGQGDGVVLRDAEARFGLLGRVATGSNVEVRHLFVCRGLAGRQNPGHCGAASTVAAEDDSVVGDSRGWVVKWVCLGDDDCCHGSLGELLLVPDVNWR